MENKNALGPMLNAYPDSMGGTLGDIAAFLAKPEMQGTFSSFYILPSMFNTDLDRGFSVINYDLNQLMAKKEDLEKLQSLGIDLKLDFILNHASVLSEQFQDILKNGKDSKYRDFFIDWNQFWEGHGTMTEEGYIQPDEALIKNMFFRKPGLPILMVRMPDGTNVPYWNTFYQEVRYPRLDPQDIMEAGSMQYCVAEQLAKTANAALDAGKTPKEMDFGSLNSFKDTVVSILESRRRYLGQMDLNIRSPLVWEHYENTLRKLSEYGAKIVRLDAFAYAPKEPGEKNFLNDPGTWDLLDKVRVLADKYGVTLLPEIHASYGEKTYDLVASKGYMVYDFFLPGLLIHAIEKHNSTRLLGWAQEILDKKMRTVNMLGCHDGIPMLDLKGLVPDEEIQELIDLMVSRGGFVKNLHGAKNMYYQVNATYFSALGDDERKMLLARAVQLFMPGKPQVWYLDMFAGKNDHEAVARAGAGGHKEINRTNLTREQMAERLEMPIVKKQLELLQLRSHSRAFSEDAVITVNAPASDMLEIEWSTHDSRAKLTANLTTYNFVAEVVEDGGVTVISQ